MAKKSMINRELKRQQVAERFRARRTELRTAVRNLHLTSDERRRAANALAELPRDGSPCRQRRRCSQSGRPRGVYRKFGLGRMALRELAMRGDIPGLHKASW
ncbi:MAG: 30S ribosomal protein S14 [Gammaproteobacteria bacterium]